MTKRLLPSVLGLTAAYAALLLFLALLGRIFAEERSDADTEVKARQRALQQYAKVALGKRLHDALASVERRIDAAAADPLIDAEGTLFVVDGERLLPRAPPRPVGAGLPPDDEASERPFVDALRSAKSDADVERAVRGLLAHRARWKIPVAHDCEAVCEVVELLLARGRAAPSLLDGLLRTGFQGQDGLQRRLLRSRGQLSDDEAQRWCARIAELSRRAGVPADDFEARCKDPAVPDGELPSIDDVNEGNSLVDRWYVERQGRVLRGLAVDVDDELGEVAGSMRQLGLISGADQVRLDGVESARWSEAATRAQGLFRLKVGLLTFAAVLGAGLLALALVAQRRKLRFVELKEDFVSAVSHELKTPLASMRVMAETLQLRLEGHAPAKDYPARLVAEVDGLHALVENILSFNRIDKGRWKPQLQRFPLASLVPVLEEDAKAWPLPVTVRCEGFEGAELDADGELIRLCLLNLLRNACRYNARTPVEVTFTFDAPTRVLRVRDNGIGIAPTDRERVFEDFVRLKAVGAPARAGSGLGLALCRRVMAMHGGSITVESSGPEGTTFALRF